MNKLYSDEGSLNNYFAFPKGLLGLGLRDTDKSVYLLLLDRARLSARSGDAWRDEQGRTFLFYPIASLAGDLGCGKTAVYDAMNALEEKDLIARQRQGWGKPNRIYVKLPEEVRISGGHDLRIPEGHALRFPGTLSSGSPDPNKKEREKKRDFKERQHSSFSYGTKKNPSAGPTPEEYERMRRQLERMEQCNS